MNKEDVKDFLNKINPSLLIMGCKKFMKKNREDIAYMVSWKLMHSSDKKLHYMLAGAKIVMVTWNAGVFNDCQRRLYLV